MGPRVGRAHLICFLQFHAARRPCPNQEHTAYKVCLTSGTSQRQFFLPSPGELAACKAGAEEPQKGRRPGAQNHPLEVGCSPWSGTPISTSCDKETNSYGAEPLSLGDYLVRQTEAGGKSPQRQREAYLTQGGGGRRPGHYGT